MRVQLITATQPLSLQPLCALHAVYVPLAGQAPATCQAPLNPEQDKLTLSKWFKSVPLALWQQIYNACMQQLQHTYVVLLQARFDLPILMAGALVTPLPGGQVPILIINSLPTEAVIYKGTNVATAKTV